MGTQPHAIASAHHGKRRKAAACSAAATGISQTDGRLEHRFEQRRRNEQGQHAQLRRARRSERRVCRGVAGCSTLARRSKALGRP